MTDSHVPVASTRYDYMRRAVKMHAAGYNSEFYYMTVIGPPVF